MDLLVLGPGCPKCETLAANTKEAADELKLDYTLEKVQDIMKITSFGVMSTPALVVDGAVKSVGKVLSVEKIKSIIG